MNPPSSTPPPADDLASLNALGKLLALLSDPKATAARVKSVTDATAESAALLEKIKTETVTLDKQRQTMADERAAHEARLRKERAEWEAERAHRSTALREAEEKAAAAQASADAARQRAVALSNDLEQRLALMHAASTAPLPARH